MREGENCRRNCQGNLAPAPFALTEGIVRGIVEDVLGSMARRGIIELPLLPEKLVDRPRPSQDPRLAKANDDSLAPPPGETIRTGEDGPRGAASENQLVPETAPHSSEPAPSAGIGSRPGDGAEAPRRGNLPTIHLSTGGEPRENGYDARSLQPPAAPTLRAVADAARKADVMHRQRKDREARELEAPVDRLAVIRQAAAKLAARPAAAPRIPAGIRTERPATPLPATPYAALRARLEAAIAFLKQRCILVQVINRDALVREDPDYRLDAPLLRRWRDRLCGPAGVRGMSHWRDRARSVIAGLTRDLPEEATLAERRKALWGKGWRAHEGTVWGRKMWGQEVRKHLALHGDSTGRVSGKPVAWPADIHFPFREGADGQG